MAHYLAPVAKHIKVLGKGDPDRLGNAGVVRQFLIDLVFRVGMQPLGEPMLHDVPVEISKLGREPFEDEGGISALACLSTSHVAIHTWPLRSEFHLDLYSCRFYNPQAVLDFINEVFHVEKTKVTDVTTGCDW
jgi:S-adenosylmethionine/arginine decarboxylase-like enzyme